MSSTNKKDKFDEELILLRNSWDKWKKFLQVIPFFNQLNDDKLKCIADRVRMTRYERAKIIAREIEISDSFQIIVQGQADCYKGSDGSYTKKAELKCGNFFGGTSLFYNLPNAATIQAGDNLVCLIISRDVFTEELKTVIEKLEQAANQYQAFMNQQI